MFFCTPPLGHWGIGAPLFTPDVSTLSSRAASKEGRLADGLARGYCFFGTTGLTGSRLFLPFPGLSVDRLQQARPSL